jgi:hypothetical protein
MTVEQFIAKLQECPKDAEVLILINVGPDTDPQCYIPEPEYYENQNTVYL